MEKWVIKVRFSLNWDWTNYMQQSLWEANSSWSSQIPSFNETITDFTRARYPSLSWARWIQSMTSIPLFEDAIECYSPVYAYVFKVVSRILHRNPLCTCPFSHTCHMPCPSHSLFDHPNYVEWGIDHEAYYALSSRLLLPTYSAKISSIPSSRTPQSYDPPWAWGSTFGAHIN
jgi:hypothetical protein